jgi:pilus assembly protein CpaC
MKMHKISYIFAGLFVLIFSAVSFAAIPVNVTVGKGTIITLKEPSKRVSIADPEIADLNLVSPTEIIVNGKTIGTTNLIVWDKSGKPTFFDIKVFGDISELEEKIKELAPNDDIRVELSNDTIVLSGYASNQQTINKAIQLAQTYAVASETKTSTKYSAGVTETEVTTSGKVLNHIKTEEAQQIVLEVRVAQIDKTKMKELGIGAIVQGIGGNDAEAIFPGLSFFPSGTLGALKTVEGEVIGKVLSDFDPVTGEPKFTAGTVDTFLAKSDIVPGVTGFDLDQQTPQIGVAHFPSGVAAMLKALASKGYAKILAEPNLTVRSGEQGNFHVGTRFPIQTVQGIGATATVSITYEEIGIRLNFAPEVMDTGAIRLKIDPAEVSNIQDFVRLQNFVAPIVDTRTVKTSVDLRDGESLVLAGLLDEQTKKNIQKVPILGDIPIFGAIFRSTSDQLEKTELAFFITPRMVKPLAPGVKPALPGEEAMTPEEEQEFQWIPLPLVEEEKDQSEEVK